MTPTALVSFLGSVCKSSCLLVLTAAISQLKWIHFSLKPQMIIDMETFDAASRGPWGAFMLAVSKHRTTLLATGASLIMITSLLIDPFLQLVFQFPIRLTQVRTNSPNIQTSQVYDPTGLPPRVNSKSYGATKVDAAMQAAILSPIWGTTGAPSMPCSFERCEWPTITTLGVCGTCVNLTDTVQRSCRVNYNDPSSAILCNYTIPSSNVTLNATFGLAGGASSMKPYHTLWSSKATLPNLVEPGTAHIGGVAFVKLDPDLVWEDYIHGKVGSKNMTADPPIVEAMQCNLDLCARTFTNPTFANFSAVPLKGPKTKLVMPVDPWVEIMKNGSTFPTTAMLAELEPASSDHVPLNTTAGFKINLYDYNDILAYLKDLFSVSYASEGAKAQSVTSGDSVVITPNLGLLLSQVTNMTELFESIADSMTEAFRTSANSTEVEGIGMNPRTYIHVRWVWLALPVSLIVLTLVLFILVVLRARALAVPVWKTSSLPLLFCDMEGWSPADKEAAMMSLQELEDRANKMSGRTDGGKNGVLVMSNVI